MDAIKEVVVRLGADSVGGEATAHAEATRILLHVGNASGELRKEGKIAANKWKIIDLFTLNDLTDRGVLRLEERDAGGDFDSLRLETRVQ